MSIRRAAMVLSALVVVAFSVAACDSYDPVELHFPNVNDHAQETVTWYGNPPSTEDVTSVTVTSGYAVTYSPSPLPVTLHQNQALIADVKRTGNVNGTLTIKTTLAEYTIPLLIP